MLDLIIEKDANAVIVLQADHGLHCETSESIAKAFGDDICIKTDIWNSVMSAIRVPEQYQTGEEDYAIQDPRNMARYLVNAFVGNNYDYVA